MPAHKSGKKDIIGHDVLQAMSHEVAHIRTIASKILDEIDKNIARPAVDEEDRLHCDRVFGSKASLTDTLVQITDLLLRLSPPVQKDAPEVIQSVAVRDEDVKLVQAFVKRVKTQKRVKKK